MYTYILQKDVFVVSCDLVTDVALHHLADIHRNHDASLSALLAPVPQTSADREAAANPKVQKKTVTTGTVHCIFFEIYHGHVCLKDFEPGKYLNHNTPIAYVTV